jgi:UDP-N-acetyl-D-mannosaminuronic acid dehydrogenase
VNFNTISVIGLGYVGLPTAAIFASKGIKVIGVDNNDVVVKVINQGKVHIIEPDLDSLVSNAVKNNQLSAANKPKTADAFIIAVPTPFKDNQKPDLSFLIAAAKSLVGVLKKGDLIVVESTVPVGTTQYISEFLSDLCPNLIFPHQSKEADINIAHSPERVLPGKILTELIKNDRVIGGISEICGKKAKELYSLLNIKGKCLLTTAATAELVKLSENAFRDVNIAFANELSIICESLRINPWEAIKLANHHPRVNILQPGPGVGGHCIAIDPWFIVESAPETSDLIRTARKVNDAKPEYIAKKIIAKVSKEAAPIIACLGLSYKADIDDMRQSPALEVVLRLANAMDKIKEYKILAVEPNIKVLPPELRGIQNLNLTSLDDALNEANIVVLLVDHKLFKEIGQNRLKNKQIFDTRGIWQF